MTDKIVKLYNEEGKYIYEVSPEVLKDSTNFVSYMQDELTKAYNQEWADDLRKMFPHLPPDSLIFR